MRRIISTILLSALFFLLLSSVACCEKSTWDCPECGRTGNTGNFCGNCAHPAPWGSARGFEISADEVFAEMPSLYQQAKSWTKSSVPQTLDQFPLWPKQMPQMFEEYMTIPLEFATSSKQFSSDYLGYISFPSKYLVLKANIESILPEINSAGEVGFWFWDNDDPDELEPGYLVRIEKNTFVFADESVMELENDPKKCSRAFSFEVSIDHTNFREHVSADFSRGEKREDNRKINIQLFGYDVNYSFGWTIQSDNPDVVQFTMNDELFREKWGYVDEISYECTAYYSLKTRELIHFSPYAQIIDDKKTTSAPTEKPSIKTMSLSVKQGKSTKVINLDWDDIDSAYQYKVYYLRTDLYKKDNSRKFVLCKTRKVSNYSCSGNAWGWSKDDPDTFKFSLRENYSYTFYVEAEDKYGNIVARSNKVSHLYSVP